MADQEQSVETQNSETEDQTTQEAGEQQVEDDTSTTTDPDSQEQTGEEEEEIEIDGEKFALPKSKAEKLKAERLMHADYTKKTQEVAEVRKAAESERDRAKQLKQVIEQEFEERAKLHHVSDLISQYQKVNWAEAYDTDAAAAGKAQAQLQQLMSEKTQLEQSLAQKHQQRGLAEQQETAKLIQEAEAYVTREIPSWTAERGAQLQQYAVAEGVVMNEKVARTLIEQPAFLKIMHKAAMFDQLEKKQSAKPKTPAPPPAPVTRVGAARATVRKDPTKMSDQEWYRERQERQRKR
jgi:hypothetical protein